VLAALEGSGGAPLEAGWMPALLARLRTAGPASTPLPDEVPPAAEASWPLPQTPATPASQQPAGLLLPAAPELLRAQPPPSAGALASFLQGGGGAGGAEDSFSGVGGGGSRYGGIPTGGYSVDSSQRSVSASRPSSALGGNFVETAPRPQPPLPEAESFDPFAPAPPGVPSVQPPPGAAGDAESSSDDDAAPSKPRFVVSIRAGDAAAPPRRPLPRLPGAADAPASVRPGTGFGKPADPFAVLSPGSDPFGDNPF